MGMELSYRSKACYKAIIIKTRVYAISKSKYMVKYVKEYPTNISNQAPGQRINYRMMALTIKHLERNKITMNYDLHEKPVSVETYLKFDLRFNKPNTSH